MREKCGIIGAFSFTNKDVSKLLVKGLESLQHRGQESWGIAIIGHEVYKKLGLVIEDPRDVYDILKLHGNIGIGHVRYSTKGKTTLKNSHPIKASQLITLAHNGTILNAEELVNLTSKGKYFSNSITDTELIGIRLTHLFQEKKDWLTTFQLFNQEINGSYSMVILTEKGELLAARDEKGFRPLCLGYQENSDTYLIASESCALDFLDANLIRDIKPGELIKIDKNGLSSFMFSNEENHAFCPFEFTYLSYPSSYLEGVNVYCARKKIGIELAKKYQLTGDVIIPVPDSARPAAQGFSMESQIPFEEGLMKGRYRKRGSLRSFIEPVQKRREEIVKKITAIRPIVEGKDVIVVDDSIVRGTSSSIIVEILKKAHVRKISFISTFPPIRFPCYAGIDFPTQEELISYKISKDIKDMNLDCINKRTASALSIDFVGYNDINCLSRGIGLPKNEFCFSCVTGDYSCLHFPPKFRTKSEMKG